jgi:DDE superfamily endonuclease
MTPQQIAAVRPRLLAFAAKMLGGLARKDQRAADELYVRGLLTGGRRKLMQPIAARLGVEHQRLQQFITSSTWDYAAVRRNVARWFAGCRPVQALAVDDTGFPATGRRRRAWPGSTRAPGQGRQLPDRGERAPGERARLVRRGLAAALPGKLGRFHPRRPRCRGPCPPPPRAGWHP